MHTVHNRRLPLRAIAYYALCHVAEIWQNVTFHTEYFSSNSFAVLNFGRPCVSSKLVSNGVDEI